MQELLAELHPLLCRYAENLTILGTYDHWVARGSLHVGRPMAYPEFLISANVGWL